MKLEPIRKISLSDFLTDNYLAYGKFVNLHRAIPGTDGLKPVHRRILMGLRKVADGHLVPSMKALGAVQELHPFGDISLKATMADMVRLGATTGDGSFGLKLIEDIPAAAVRYTQQGLSNKQSDYNFRLIDYCPDTEGETAIEPEYLITPVPYALVHGGLNWGLGILGRTPAFTYESLINAYEKDDPNLLVSSYGYELDYKKSDLKELWETGVGRVTLKYKMQRMSEDHILLMGSGELFKPTMKAFKSLLETGQIVIFNESSKVIVQRIARASRSKVNMDDVYKTAVMATTKARYYNILVVQDEHIRTIGIKEWLHLTMTRYKEAFSKYKVDRVTKCEYQIKVLEFLPVVGRSIIDNLTDEQILAKHTGLTEEVLSSIKRKSISSMRKSEYSNDILALNKQIVSIKAEDVDSVIRSYIKE